MVWYGRIVVSIEEKDREKRKKIKEFLKEKFEGITNEIDVEKNEIYVDVYDTFQWDLLDKLIEEIKKQFLFESWYLEKPPTYLVKIRLKEDEIVTESDVKKILENWR